MIIKPVHEYRKQLPVWGAFARRLEVMVKEKLTKRCLERTNTVTKNYMLKRKRTQNNVHVYIYIYIYTHIHIIYIYIYIHIYM